MFPTLAAANIVDKSCSKTQVTPEYMIIYSRVHEYNITQIYKADK